MQRSLKILGLVALVVMVGAIGAGMCAVLDQETEPTEPTMPAVENQVRDLPNMAQEDVEALLKTYIEMQTIIMGGLFPTTCLGQRSIRAQYIGNASWMVDAGLCKFVISDETGKVTGP